jgi:hypothetical protein
VNGGQNPRESGADVLLGCCVALLQQRGWCRSVMDDGVSFWGYFARGRTAAARLVDGGLNPRITAQRRGRNIGGTDVAP